VRADHRRIAGHQQKEVEMISDAEIVVNRCVKPGCDIVAMLVSRRAGMIMVREFAGNTPCEKITDHDMPAWMRESIIRDVLILRALWTVGRSITPGRLSDPTAHILADSIGWTHGEPAEISSVPAWLRETSDSIEVSWGAVMLALRVAECTREEWPAGYPQYKRWNRIAEYLRLWSDRVH
jgi:hypothetical protein